MDSYFINNRQKIIDSVGLDTFDATNKISRLLSNSFLFRLILKIPGST